MDDIETAFLARVRKTATCWLWIGGTNPKYGVFSVHGKHVYAHRWSYEHWVGPIPDGLQIDHLCRTPLCVRPDHLEPVTNKENHRRGLKAQQTHCKRGHEFTAENTKIKTNGTRSCRACNLMRQRKRQGYQGLPPKTHCLRGHEYTPENTRIKPNGTRECVECRRIFKHSRRPKVVAADHL